MFSTFYQKIGQLIRNLLPFETTLALLLLGVLIWPIPFIGAISPSLVLIAVYYWSAYRPDLFRPLPVFCIGLLNDAIHYLPLGLSAFIFLAIQQLVTSQRRYLVGQVFLMLWIGFVIVAFLSMFVTWLALSFFYGEVVAVVPILVQFLLTVALFPLPAWCLIRLQRAFLSQEAPT